MSNVQIEDVTGEDIGRQAAEAHAMAAADKAWLQQYRLDIWTRHRSLAKSLESLTRAVLSDTLSTHLLRYDSRPIGRLTIIPHIDFIHKPSGNRIAGRQIDICTVDGLDDDLHRAAVEQAARHHDYHGTVIGLLAPHEEERARGIPLSMWKQVSEGGIEVLGDDPHGLGQIATLAVYTMEV